MLRSNYLYLSCVCSYWLSSYQLCILSDGNKEEFNLTPEFYKKELRIVGSSDGLDYKKHASWFLKHVKNTSFVSRLFEHEINHRELIQCFQELSEEKIKPIKVLVTYGD